MNNSNLICVNCGFSEHLDDALYCQNCGIDLSNFCSNDDCEINNVTEPEYATLPNNAKYCPYCGSKTTYFEYLSKNDHNSNNN